MNKKANFKALGSNVALLSCQTLYMYSNYIEVIGGDYNYNLIVDSWQTFVMLNSTIFIVPL